MAGQMMTWRQLTETYRISPGELSKLIAGFKDSGGQVGRFGVSDGEDLPIDLFFPLETAPLCKDCGRPMLEDEDEELPRWLLELNKELCLTCLSKLPVTALLENHQLPLYTMLVICNNRLSDVRIFLSLDSAREELRQLSGQEDAETKVTEGEYAGSVIVKKYVRPTE